MKALLKVFIVIFLFFGFSTLFAQGEGGNYIKKKSRMAADNYILDKAQYNNILYILALGDEYNYYDDEYYAVYKIIVFDKSSSFFVDEKVLTKIAYHNLAPTPQKIILKNDGVYVEWITYNDLANPTTYLKKAMNYYKDHSYSSQNSSSQNKTDYYASLAISEKRYKYGYSYKYTSLNEAKQRALNECNNIARDNSCFTLVWAKNQCIAFAGYANSYGWGKADDKKSAKQYALDSCKQYSGRNCSLLMSVCADGR